MTRTSISALCGALALWFPLLPAYGDTSPEGVEVQARGPIHEAFAQPVVAQPEPGPMAPKEPPALIDEAPPDQKPTGDKVQWIPGYWQWDEDKKEFLWVSGFWRQTPPGRTWIAGHYTKTADGWQWVAGYWSGDKQAPLLPEPPAPVQAEPGAPPPNDDSLYVPGMWVYRDGRYRWRAAYYLDYRPGWIWHPAQYVWTPDGYVFVEGYWDYPLDERGLLFAPVAIDAALYAQPNWTYTPSYVVNCDFLPTALFVRAHHHHYYFGDYFGAAHAKRGFTPWIDYRHSGRGYDPLFAYYRLGNNAARWERNLRTVYTGRQNGDATLPPHTWAQQQALVRSVTADKTTTAAHLRQVTALTPLAKVDPKVARLQAVTPTERRGLERQLTQAHEQGRQRHEVEAAKPSGKTIVRTPPSKSAGVIEQPHHVAPAPKVETVRPAPAHRAEAPRATTKPPSARPAPRSSVTPPTHAAPRQMHVAPAPRSKAPAPPAHRSAAGNRKR